MLTWIEKTRADKQNNRKQVENMSCVQPLMKKKIKNDEFRKRIPYWRCWLEPYKWVETKVRFWEYEKEISTFTPSSVAAFLSKLFTDKYDFSSSEHEASSPKNTPTSSTSKGNSSSTYSESTASKQGVASISRLELWRKRVVVERSADVVSSVCQL